MIALARNSPVALVVGAAGFLGSHLCEALLKRGVQVIGIDNLQSGKIKNLNASSKNKNFHFLHQGIDEPFKERFERLDYAFFLVCENQPQLLYKAALNGFLNLCQDFVQDQKKIRIVFISSIKLYDTHSSEENLLLGERLLARFSIDNKINSRIVRLAPVFGPRMHIFEEDPTLRLIKASVKGSLAEETTTLDFISRSLFIDDAVNLLIKALLHGATAQKIYDGALLSPIKVAEIKQVLLDPLWHETQGFKPTPLPPWPTPNLNRTQKELSWRPVNSLVSALKKTVVFLKENPEYLTEEDQIKHQSQGIEKENRDMEDPVKEKLEEKKSRFKVKLDFTRARSQVIFLICLSVIIYALFYPLISFTFGVLSIRSHLSAANKYLSEGEMQKAEKEVALSQKAVEGMNGFLDFTRVVRATGYFKDQFNKSDLIMDLLRNSINATGYTTQGIADLSQALNMISGEEKGETTTLLAQANLKLERANALFNIALAQSGLPEINSNTPFFIRDRVKDLNNKITNYQKITGLAKSLTFLLPQLLGKEEKSYLTLLTDNQQHRAGGGVVRSFSLVTFAENRLKSIKTEDIDKIDKSLTEISAPPQLKEDYGIKSWGIGEVATEPDSPTNARFALWLYLKSAQGDKKSPLGVINLDLDAISSLLEVVGPLKLTTFSDPVTAGNFKEIKKTLDNNNDFLVEVEKEVLNKIFFAPSGNWVEIGRAFDQALKGKHLTVYLPQPTLFSYINSLGFSGTFPRATKKEPGEYKEIISLVDSAVIKGDFYQKKVSLTSKLDPNLILTHKLIISYPTTVPRLRQKIYLNAGTKITKASWGETDLLAALTPFSDYGLAGYSLVIDPSARPGKELMIHYQDSEPMSFKDNKLNYQLDVIKQLGSQNDKFEFRLEFPEGFKSSQPQSSIDTELFQDKTFKTTLTQMP